MRRLIVVVLGLALVLVGLDFAARAAAQAALAREVQASEGLAQQPDVSVEGFPFLLQAVRGRFQRVEVQLQEVPTGGELRLDSVHARLTGVDLPLPALLGSRVTEVPVDAVHVTGSATYATLDTQVNAAIPSGLATVHLADGGNGRLKVAATYNGLGGPLTVSGLATVSISRGRLALTVPPEDLADVPEVFRTTVAQLLSQTVPLQQLPLGLVATSVTVTSQGVTATADARDIVLRTQATG